MGFYNKAEVKQKKQYNNIYISFAVNKYFSRTFDKQAGKTSVSN